MFHKSTLQIASLGAQIERARSLEGARTFSLLPSLLPSLLLSLLAFGISACDDDTSASPEVAPSAGMTNRAGQESVDPILGGQTTGGAQMMNTAGTNTAGTNTAGTNTAGTNTAGTSTAGVEMAGTNTAGTEAGGADIAGMPMAGVEMAGTEVEEVKCGAQPDWRPSEQSGVAYISHFASPELIWYYLDRTSPVEGGRVMLESITYDMDIDGSNDLVAFAHDVTQTVSIYELRRPDQPGEEIGPPTLLAEIDTTPYTPRRVIFDEARNRLHVIANDVIPEGSLLREEYLLSYQLAPGEQPVPYGEGPFAVPVTTNVDIDPRAGILFLVGLTDKTLYLYDISGPNLVPQGGDPIELQELYPEPDPGFTGFGARNVQVDPIRGRVWIARSQGATSEIMGFSYPPVTTSPDDMNCAPTYAHSDLVKIEDPFDVSVLPADRVNLLGGFRVTPSIGENLVLFLHDAWNGIGSTAMVSALAEGANGALEMLPACQDFEGFGCFFRSYLNNNPSIYQRTDGGACFDQTHRVYVGTSVDSGREDDPGQVFFFSIDAMGNMSRLLSDEGRTHTASSFPFMAVCH